MNEEPNFIRAQEKIGHAREWRGDVNVSLGDETVTFEHRLLNESEFLELKQALELEELQKQDNVGQTESQERLLELQQKGDDLTDEEEEELERLTREVAGEMGTIEDALGEDGYDVLTDMGKKAIEPSDEDVQYVYDLPPSEMKRVLGIEQLPNPLTESAVRDALREKLREMISGQPYPIKLNVGMQAMSETMSVLGNGLPAGE